MRVGAIRSEVFAKSALVLISLKTRRMMALRSYGLSVVWLFVGLSPFWLTSFVRQRRLTHLHQAYPEYVEGPESDKDVGEVEDPST